MKRTFLTHLWRTRVLTGAVALGTVLACAGRPTPSYGAPSPSQSADQNKGGIEDHLKKWETDMTDAFRDTYHKLWGEKGAEKMAGSVSADLREEKNDYTLRLSLPDRSVDKVQFSLKDGALSVVAPEQGKMWRYEQTFDLADVPAGAQPSIDRQPKDNLIVVTVPKAKPETPASNATPPAAKDESSNAFSNEDYGILKDMRQMRREMDHIFVNASKDLGIPPGEKKALNEAGFDSSYKLEDKGGQYVIHDYMPQRDVKNASVTVKDGQLKIEAKAHNTTTIQPIKGASEVIKRASDYTQIISLPGPVNSAKMTVDRKDGMIKVILPKTA